MESKTEEELSGLERAAVLLLSLGEDAAAEVMKHLGPREVQRLGAAMAKLRKVSPTEAHEVIRSFRSRSSCRPPWVWVRMSSSKAL